MNDPKNITISLLCVSAAILAALLIVGHRPEPARADTPVVGGDYIMVTGSYSTKIDLLYVIDLAAQKMNVYAFNAGNDAFELFDQANLKLLFRPEAP